MKRMVTPIIIVLVVLAINAGYLAVILTTPVPTMIKIIFGIAAVAVSGALVYVLIERINEIRKGNEDDLGKY